MLALLRHRLASSFVLIGMRVLAAALGLFIQLLLARHLSANGLGIFYFATSLPIVMGTLAALGYPAIITPLIARYRTRGRTFMLRAFIRRIRIDTVLAGLLASGVVIGLVLLGFGVDNSLQGPVIAGALAIPAIALLRNNGSIAAALRAGYLSYLPDLLLRPLLFIAVILVVLLVRGDLSPTVTVACMSSIMMAVALFQAVLLRAKLPSTAGARIGRRLVRTWRARGGLLIVLSIVVALFADLDLVLLGPLLSPTELAVFGASLKLALMVGFAIQVQHELIGPDIAEALLRDDRGAINRAMHHANVMPALISLGAMIVIAAGYCALVILTFAQLTRAACGPSIGLLLASGREQAVWLILAGSLVILIGANMALVPTFGINGAALAAYLSIAFSSLALAWLAFRWTGVRTDLLAIAAGR